MCCLLSIFRFGCKDNKKKQEYRNLENKYPYKSLKIVASAWNFTRNCLYLHQNYKNMDTTNDIRWIQRLDNYEKAVKRLEDAASLLTKENLYNSEADELMKEGLIQRYEYTQELAWKLMKDYEEYQGYTDIQGSRDAIRKALAMGLVSDKAWMDTIVSRNITSHCYDEEEFNAVYQQIMTIYVPLFHDFLNVIKSKKETCNG